MNLEPLRKLGLSENEIKIYLTLLKIGSSTSYEISKKTGIYRVHVYDKLEQLMNRGLVTYVFKGATKHFQATHPNSLKQYIEDKKSELIQQELAIEAILPELEELRKTPKEDTIVEVFKGVEGLKYFLKDVITTKSEVLIIDIDDAKYNEALPLFMPQYFKALRNQRIKERIITVKRKNIFLFDKKIAPTTEYRFLEEKQFNPTNTAIYEDKVVIVTWGTPVIAIMIRNRHIADTHRKNFEYLWKIASLKNF